MRGTDAAQRRHLVLPTSPICTLRSCTARTLQLAVTRRTTHGLSLRIRRKAVVDSMARPSCTSSIHGRIAFPDSALSNPAKCVNQRAGSPLPARVVSRSSDASAATIAAIRHPSIAATNWPARHVIDPIRWGLFATTRIEKFALTIPTSPTERLREPCTRRLTPWRSAAWMLYNEGTLSFEPNPSSLPEATVAGELQCF